MGKVDPGIVSVSGKFGNLVIANRKKKKYTRSVVAKGTKKDESALKQQYNRTAALNKLAGSLKNEFKAFLRHYRRSDLYQYFLKLFRRADSMNRFVLLAQLKEEEFSPKYPLTEHCKPILKFDYNKTTIIFRVNPEAQPTHKVEEFNSWYFELLLLQWEDGKDEINASRKLSEWVLLTDPVPVFEFEFPRIKNVRECLVTLRLRWGINKELQKDMRASSAQVIEVGSFNTEDLVILEEATKQMKIRMEKKYGREEEEEGERVKAKGT